MNTKILLLGFVATILLTGCSARIGTSMQTDSMADIQETEKQITAPGEQNSQEQVEIKSDTVLQAPALKTGTDTQSLDADLDTTVIGEESFK